jgi:alkyl hydroperoxide reductase subunit AhpC
MAKLNSEFDKRNCKVIGLSEDPVGNHARWAVDIQETQGYAVNYPIIGDLELKVAKLYDMLPDEAGNTSEGGPKPTPPCARYSSSARTRRSRRC